MNHDITPRTTDDEDEGVFDVLERGIAQQQQQQQQQQQSGRFEAVDDHKEDPPVPRHHDSPQGKHNLQLAPPMEPGALDEAYAASPPVSSARIMIAEEDSASGNASVSVPPHVQQTTNTQPGAVQVTGPGVRLFGRRRPPDAEDQRTVMTPVAAELVQETPLVMAVPAPGTPNWWTKRRNQFMVAGVLTLVVALAVVVTVLIMSGKNDSNTLLDATPPPSPQTPTMTPVPTTVFPTTTAPPTTTASPNATTTPSPTSPVPTTPVSTTVPPKQWQWKQMGQDMDGEAANDRSGWSVSLSANGTTVAIGADSNDGNGDRAGHVRIYQWDGGGWVQLGNDLDGESSGDYSGASVSLSADGTTVAIGAVDNSSNGDLAGHVRIYQWDGGGWAQLGNDLDGEAAYDRFGASVSLSADGTTIAIGAPYNNGNGGDAGHVRVYRLTGTDWVQLGNDLDGEASFVNSGKSVSLSADGTTVAIGAPGNWNYESRAGYVRVHQLTGNDWIQVGSDLDGETAGDSFGKSVSLSADGTTLAVGADENDGNGNSAGHVRMYQLAGVQWIQVGNDLDGEGAYDRSGWSISLSADGTTVAIGAYGNNNGNGVDAGHVRVYRHSGADWVQLGNDMDGEAKGDWSGFSVCLSADGTTVAVGAQYNDGNGTENAGHVRVYRLEEQ